MSRNRAVVAGIAAGLCLVAGAEMSEIRVRQTPTGPKIFEKGVAINPRVCYTRAIMRRIPVGLDWKLVSYKTTSHRTMNVQYRVSGSALLPDAGIEIRDFRITDEY